MNVFIYALCEPDTRTIRYIGKAKDVKRRLKQHWRNSKKCRNHLGCWLASLDTPPSVFTLKEISESEWEEWERRYIRCARALGFDLVNATDGGDGLSVGAKFSDSHRANMSKAVQRRLKNGEIKPLKGKFGSEHPRFGIKESAEVCKRMGDSRRGKRLSESHRANISKGVRRFLEKVQ